MFGFGDTSRFHRSLDTDVLDEILGEALIVVENPDRYPTYTVEMARRALDMIERLRGRGDEAIADGQAA